MLATLLFFPGNISYFHTELFVRQEPQEKRLDPGNVKVQNKQILAVLLWKFPCERMRVIEKTKLVKRIETTPTNKNDVPKEFLCRFEMSLFQNYLHFSWLYTYTHIGDPVMFQTNTSGMIITLSTWKMIWESGWWRWKCFFCLKMILWKYSNIYDVSSYVWWVCCVRIWYSKMLC